MESGARDAFLFKVDKAGNFLNLKRCPDHFPATHFPMCCFSGPVSSVTNTRIFARWLLETKPARQFITYQMRYQTKREIAMILPLPVVKNSPEDAVKFLDLEKEPEFFERIEALFPVLEVDAAAPVSGDGLRSAPLQVIKVGSFEASFVPGQADFSRLDPRFRIEDKIWKKLPQYADWGFAVFKLRKDATTVHPMAFSFPNAQHGMGLFFPTVHIHDGNVHAEEKFSHTLYCQTPSGNHGPKGWEESAKLPASLGKLNDSGLLDRTGHVYRRSLTGMLRNVDTYA
jgi:hypothetical protein